MINKPLDCAYLADTLKFLRELHSYTQENLAHESGLTTRTIEKLESGKHTPNQQTLKSLARAFKLEDISIFYKPSEEEQKDFQERMEKIQQKTIAVEMTEINSLQGFMLMMTSGTNFRALRCDMSSVKNEEAMGLASKMIDYLTDIGDVWDDITKSDQLQCAHEFIDMCKDLEKLDCICKMGQHKQKQIAKNPLTVDVVVMIVFPKEVGKNIKTAAIQLEDGWAKVA